MSKFPLNLGKIMVLGSLLCSVSCAHKPFNPAEHPVKHLAYWKQPPQPGLLAGKLRPIPPEVLDYIRKDNEAQGFPPDTVAAPPSEKFEADVRAALSELPEAVQKRVSEKLYGIYLVHKLGGTAYTESVALPGTTGHQAVGGFILLDSEVLDRTANAWASWKENSPFVPDPAWNLTLEIEEQSRDDRTHAIQYILLHEFGHVLSLEGTIHPSWDEESPKAAPPQNFAFSKLSWTLNDKDQVASLFDADFSERKGIKYYLGPERQQPLASSQIIYTKLKRTNFVTLYGATNPGDDFAEAFASYVHTVLMKRPWMLTIRKDGKIAQILPSCWKEKRCREKAQFMREHFGF